MSATTDLVDFASAAHRLPDSVRADALMLVSDTLAVGAAGSSAPGADGVLAAARGWGAGGNWGDVGATVCRSSAATCACPLPAPLSSTPFKSIASNGMPSMNPASFMR